MSFINTDVLDAALAVLDDATHLYICSAEPGTFTEATVTYALGVKVGPTFTGPQPGDVSGRKVTVDAIPDGSVTGTDSASHWALVDGSRLLAAGPLAALQSVTSGNTFSLSAFDIELPEPA